MFPASLVIGIVWVVAANFHGKGSDGAGGQAKQVVDVAANFHGKGSDGAGGQTKQDSQIELSRSHDVQFQGKFLPMRSSAATHADHQSLEFAAENSEAHSLPTGRASPDPQTAELDFRDAKKNSQDPTFPLHGSGKQLRMCNPAGECSRQDAGHTLGLSLQTTPQRTPIGQEERLSRTNWATFDKIMGRYKIFRLPLPPTIRRNTGSSRRTRDFTENSSRDMFTRPSLSSSVLYQNQTLLKWNRRDSQKRARMDLKDTRSYSKGIRSKSRPGQRESTRQKRSGRLARSTQVGPGVLGQSEQHCLQCRSSTTRLDPSCFQSAVHCPWCNCRDRSLCDVQTGNCAGDCAYGWAHPGCLASVCPKPFFAPYDQCALPCTVNCPNNAVCHPITGECYPTTNFTEPHVCPHKTHGFSCDRSCHCWGGRACNSTDGTCTEGVCSEEYTGPHCDQLFPRFLSRRPIHALLLVLMVLLYSKVGVRLYYSRLNEI